ncbi:MAG: glycoside hydrolase family 32 protein [Clostridiales bacterium]|nr:glycoside hydrolase family 32 protein [Clostridiales bacterium]
MRIKFFIFLIAVNSTVLNGQSWDLTPENINRAIRDSAINTNSDSFRPAFHLTPPTGSMGDPNGGIFYNGWYHIFYGLQPFAFHPGAWYWAHARSKDLLHWEHMKPGITPAFDLGLNAIGSGSTIITKDGKKYAIYSQIEKGEAGGMKFWRAEFKNDDLYEWDHKGKNPILTLEYPGLPPFDNFWRDPFVFCKVRLPVEEVELELNSACFAGMVIALMMIPDGSVCNTPSLIQAPPELY